MGLAFALAACTPDPAAPDPNQPAKGEEHIACAVGGARAFAEVCAVERARHDGRVELVVRHPDGAFRRFAVLDDGRGLAVADGAQQAVARFEDGFAELAVGTDRYRFPVKLGQDGPAE